MARQPGGARTDKRIADRRDGAMAASRGDLGQVFNKCLNSTTECGQPTPVRCRDGIIRPWSGEIAD
jgi:hypothetical protein